MKRILEALDVDYLQWRAVTRALHVFRFIEFGAMKRTTGKPFGFVLLFLLFGLSPALIVLRSQDILLGGVAIATNSAFLSMLIILTAYGGRLVSADDYNVLGFRPVSSRTFFAIRVTGILYHALVVSAIASVLPMAFLAWRTRAVGPVLAAAATSSVASITGGLGVVVIYGWALRAGTATRVKRLVSYLQLVFGFGWAAGYLIAIKLIVEDYQIGLSFHDVPWIWAYPGTWFASYIALAGGSGGRLEWAGLVASVAALAGVVALVRGKMSLDYAERVAALDAGSSGPIGTQRSWRPRLFLKHETRAVALLVRAHFKSDMRFRLGLLSFLPMVAIYWFMGMRTGRVEDPFHGGFGGDSIIFLQMVLLYLPQTLQQSLGTSETPEASWIFHATPSSKPRLVAASRNLITAAVLGPFLIALAAAFTYWFGNVWHALIHAFFLGLMAHTILLFAVWRDPRLPFSRKPETRPTGQFGLGMIVMIVGSILYILLRWLVYRSVTLMIGFAAVLIAVNVLLDRMTGRRVEERERELDLASDWT